MTDELKLKRIEKSLEEYLRKNPELVSYQKMMDDALTQMGDNPIRKLQILLFFIEQQAELLKYHKKMLRNIIK